MGPERHRGRAGAVRACAVARARRPVRPPGSDRGRARTSKPAVGDRLARIAALYGALERAYPSPVVALNRAAAIAMAEGPARGLELIDRLVAEGRLGAYFPLHAARADLLRRAGRAPEALTAYREALPLATNGVERAFVARRVSELGG